MLRGTERTLVGPERLGTDPPRGAEARRTLRAVRFD